MTRSEIKKYYAYETADGYEKEAVEVLAAINKVSVEDIYKIVQEENEMKNKPKMTPEIKASCIIDYNAGLSIKEIASTIGWNAHTLENNFRNWALKGDVELHLPLTQPKPVEASAPAPAAREEALQATDAEEQNQSDITSGIDRIEIVKDFVAFVEEHYHCKTTITRMLANKDTYAEIEFEVDGIEDSFVVEFDWNRRGND